MFKLLRYFSLTSLVSIVVVAALLGLFYRAIALSALIESGEANNTALARVLANSLWPMVEPVLQSSTDLSTPELEHRGTNPALSAAVATHLQGLSVATVKVYDMRGRTVFSTDAKQVGQEKSGNQGYEAAREGKVTSELVHRDQIDGFEGATENRDVLSTYIPVRPIANGPVTAVFEVYDDVTPFLGRIEQTKRQVVLVVASIMCLLYAVLFAIVGHAGRVIRRQYREREVAAKALRHAQNSL